MGSFDEAAQTSFSNNLRKESEPQGDPSTCKESQKDLVSSKMSKSLTPVFGINPEESFARNRKFIKDLELAKARLRTYAVYSPTDQELQQIAAKYRYHLQKHIRKSTVS